MHNSRLIPTSLSLVTLLHSSNREGAEIIVSAVEYFNSKITDSLLHYQPLAIACDGDRGRAIAM